MSWLYLPEAVEACSAESCSVSRRSVMSNMNPTALKFSRPVSGTAILMMHRFGMMRKPSTGAPGLDAWILSRPASPASHFRSPGCNGENQTNGTSGPIPLELLGRWDPFSSSWRTPQGSLLTLTSDIFSGPWPRAGMICAGTAYRLRPLVPVTREIGSGLWPTPHPLVGGGKKSRGQISGRWRDRMMKKMIPTPGASDYRSGKGYSHEGKKQTPQLRHLIGGCLNPEWIEWLMGWPIGWTALEPLATDRFQEWLKCFGT